MISIVKLRNYVLNAIILYIIIYKLKYWQEFCLAILLQVNKDLKLYF